MSQGAWRSVRRVLAIRLDSMGDVLMTTPAIKAVADRGCEVTLLTSPEGAEVARHVPAVADAVVYEAPWMPGGMTLPPAEDRRLIERLADRRFEAAVVFTVSTQDPAPAGLLAYLAGIPLRLGHEHCNTYGLFTDLAHDPDRTTSRPQRHEVRRQLDLVGSVGFRAKDDTLSFRPGTVASHRAATLIARHVAGYGPRVVVHPGARAASGRYDAARFGHVCELLRFAGCSPLLVAGSADAYELAQASEVSPQTPVLSGLDIATLGALIQRADGFVGNNSGPAHLAAAVGTPAAILYAGTDLQHAPWGVPAKVLRRPTTCAPCLSSACAVPGRPCLDIQEKDVVEALLDLLVEAKSDSAAPPPLAAAATG